MAEPKQKSRGATEKRLRLIEEWRRADPEFERRLHALVQRSKEEKQRAVESLLKDDAWGNKSNSEIGRQCGVSKGLVGDVREKLTGTRAPKEVVARRGKSEYTFKTAANALRARPAAQPKGPVGRPPKEEENKEFLAAASEAVRKIYKPGVSIVPPVSAEIVAWLASERGIHTHADSFRKKVSRLSKKPFEEWLAGEIASATGGKVKPSRGGTN